MTKDTSPEMGKFWDARAREDAYYFINSTLPYRESDPEEFWRSGERDVEVLLGETGANLSPDDQVVEIGCGIGRMTRALIARAGSVVALDISAEMIERAQRENADIEGIEWRVSDGVSLRPLPDGSADAVISYVVFHHMPDSALTLDYIDEIGRVLRPGGWTAFQVSDDPTPHTPDEYSLVDRVIGGFRSALGRAPKGRAHPAWKGSAVDLELLFARAEAAGMDVEHVSGRGTQLCLVLLRRR